MCVGRMGAERLAFWGLRSVPAIPKRPRGGLFFLTASLQQNNCFEDGAGEKHLFVRLSLFYWWLKKNQTKDSTKGTERQAAVSREWV